MTEWMQAVQCTGCGGLLRKFDVRLYQCSYCGTKYIILGEEYPIPGLTQVMDDRNLMDCRGMYLWSPLHVRWDSPQEVRDEARVMGIEIAR